MDYSLPILAYHSVADTGPPELAEFRVSPGAFRQQMQWLRDSGYEAVSLAEWALRITTRRRYGHRAVVITFDDGYADFLDNAAPVLAKFGLQATMFVVTGRVGGVADWDRIAVGGLPLMGWDALRLVRQQGHTIASHCDAHRVLTKLSDAEIAADAAAARAALRRELGAEVTALSYPWGRSDARVRRLCGENGYRIGVGVTPRASGLDDDVMDLPRIEIAGTDDLATFARKVSGAGTPAADAAPLTPAERDPVDGLALRLDRVVEELGAIRLALAALRMPTRSLQARLPLLFSRPLGGPEPLAPRQEIAPGIRIGFEPTARVMLTVGPKLDHRVSPESCLNTLHLSFSGRSRWLSLEVALAWPDLDEARRFQLGLAVRASRAAECRAVLRLWQKDNQYVELPLADLRLQPDERNCNVGGTLELPDALALDHRSDPLFLLLFDTGEPLEIELFYFNLYFA